MKKVLVKSKVDSKSFYFSKGDAAKPKKKLVKKNTIEERFTLAEVSEQIKALNMMKEMALSYGFDISKPACNAGEAMQWTYFGYLAALKEHDGAAMSLGSVSGFFDIYIEKDIAEKVKNNPNLQRMMQRQTLISLLHQAGDSVPEEAVKQLNQALQKIKKI